MPSALRPLLTILVLGAYSQVAQALLIRESLVVFYGNEVSLGAFYGSWLLWFAVGSAAAVSWDRRRGEAAAGALRLILCVLPLFLILQVAALRSVRWLLSVSASEFVPLGDLFLSLTLVNLPGGVLLGFAFPLVCRLLAQAGDHGARATPRAETGAGADGFRFALPILRAARVHGRAGAGGALRPVAWTYAADALGALGGGLLFTFVLIRWQGPVATLGLTTAALALTALALGPSRTGSAASLPEPPGAGSGSGPAEAVGVPAGMPGRVRWFPWPLLLVGLLISLPPIARPLGLALEHWRFASLQPGMELLDALDTPYGHVAVARLGAQHSVVADGQIQQSFPMPLEVERRAAYFLSQVAGTEADAPRRVLVLGGYPGGLAAGLLQDPGVWVDQVEQDRTAFERVRPLLAPADRAALADPRLRLHFTDARRFLRRLEAGATYDLILSLDAAPASAAGNRLFTREALELARAHLTPGGAFCTQVSAASNYVGRAVGGYAGSVYRTLRSVFPNLVLIPGDPLVFCAGGAGAGLTEDPEELRRRYLALPLPRHDLPVGTFATLLPAAEVAFQHAQLGSAAGELNTDARPVTYYLNMVLWGQFSDSRFVAWLEGLHRLGPWPYLVPPVVFVLLWLLRAAMERPGPAVLGGSARVFALTVLGFVAMAVQLALLFSYQAQVGLVFERVALLNGLFMTGLALGAAAARPLAAGAHAGALLRWLFIGAALGLLALPLLLDGLAGLGETAREAGYLGLTLALGLAAGAGFTLCVSPTDVAPQDVTPDPAPDPGAAALRGGGLAMAADSLGGALGGLVTGALMVPILGVAATSRVLAVPLLLALVPLAAARWLPTVPSVPPRARPSFPWPRLGWRLLFAVLCVYAWWLLAARSGPAPQVRFDPERLTEVSGSAAFRLAELPFVHYLGSAHGETESATVTLASAAAGADRGGFAGPIELLVAVGRDGTLRGVRYLDSRETPAYIAAIGDWLAGLSGADLTRGPLSLGRVDGLSGATVTSRAVLATINAAARAGTAAAFGRPVPPPDAAPRGGPDWGLWATGVLLLAFFPVWRWGAERARLLLLAASLVVLGLWLNTPLTEVDLVNLSQGHGPALAENPQRWLLYAFVAVSSVLFGQVWCGYLCPFGALQEFVSRLGRRLGLRAYPDHALEQAARTLKFLLLAALLVLVWTTGEGAWATFDPMQHLFSDRGFAGPTGWMFWLTLVVLAVALVHVRFWCRYLCPLGAFLALANKLALLARWGPRRRYEHCDLGVRGDHDLDCIRCHRCVTGRDTRLEPPAGQLVRGLAMLIGKGRAPRPGGRS